MCMYIYIYIYTYISNPTANRHAMSCNQPTTTTTSVTTRLIYRIVLVILHWGSRIVRSNCDYTCSGYSLPVL